MESKEESGQKLPYARSFKELAVYHKARKLAREIFKISSRFPREEAFSLTDQWRRAARSIGAQIAESWAKRRYEAHFVSKLTDCDGENSETDSSLDFALQCGYISPEQHDALAAKCAEIGRMLNGMITKAATFSSDI